MTLYTHCVAFYNPFIGQAHLGFQALHASDLEYFLVLSGQVLAIAIALILRYLTKLYQVLNYTASNLKLGKWKLPKWQCSGQHRRRNRVVRGAMAPQISVVISPWD